MIDNLPEKMQGRWDSVLMSLGVDETILNKHNQPCPFCGGTDRFRYTNYQNKGSWICSQCEGGDGFTFIERMFETDFRGACQMVEPNLDSAAVATVKVDTEQNGRRIKTIWSSTVEISEGDAVWNYLQSRRINPQHLSRKNIRYAESIPYYHDRKLVGRFPCMVSRICTSDGAGASLQIRYLCKDGSRPDELHEKVKILPPYKSYSNGGYIMVADGHVHMTVGEGVETVAKFCQKEKLGGFAAINDKNLMNFSPPPECRVLTILGDNDASYAGQFAAYGLANKMFRTRKDIVINVEVPSKVGTDWSDY